MPTLQELVDGAYRDLADEAKVVFSQLQVEDFIRGGIADVNRVAPQDVYDDITLTTDPDTGVVTDWEYPTVIELPYRVETIRLSDGYAFIMDAGDVNDGGQVTGYTFKRTPTGGLITFPQWWLSQFDAVNYSIRAHGYAPRPMPYAATPSPQVSISEEETFSVRAYARQAGFDLLAHDRSLFAQWQGQTNNSDVSPTQLMQMTANAKGDWEHQRGLIRTIRRYQ
jgi:hypothetical protein